jgi:hypothetical protein
MQASSCCPVLRSMRGGHRRRTSVRRTLPKIIISFQRRMTGSCSSSGAHECIRLFLGLGDHQLCRLRRDSADNRCGGGHTAPHRAPSVSARRSTDPYSSLNHSNTVIPVNSSAAKDASPSSLWFQCSDCLQPKNRYKWPCAPSARGFEAVIPYHGRSAPDLTRVSDDSPSWLSEFDLRLTWEWGRGQVWRAYQKHGQTRTARDSIGHTAQNPARQAAAPVGRQGDEIHFLSLREA